MMDDLGAFLEAIGIVVFALFIISPFVLTPISFIYNWLPLIKTLIIVMDIAFFTIICWLIGEKI